MCTQPLFFENSICLASGAAAGFDPARRDLVSLRTGQNGLWEEISEGTYAQWGNCANLNACGSNWLLPADSAAAMEHQYANGPKANWEDAHASAYATMHSWEDWAEHASQV